MEKAVALNNGKGNGDLPLKKKVKQILDEETYTDHVEKIIVRDFFPDHEQLKDQHEYLDAEEKKDFERMRQIALKYAAVEPSGNRPGTLLGTTPLPSPATFETPCGGTKRPSTDSALFKSGNAKRKDNIGDNFGYETKGAKAASTPEVKQNDQEVGLDKFLSKYTSEDNESFNGIMERTEQARRDKHAWLYEAEERHAETTKKILQLEGALSQPLAITDGSSVKGTLNVERTDERTVTPVHTWEYKNKNPLMYYPEGINKPEDEMVFKKPRLIEHKNTRFALDPFKSDGSRAALAQAASENKAFKGEKVGHDGKSIIPQESPRVGGYGLVATPSPMPGVNESPLMTWGEIESTPGRLDTFTPGPSFRFPNESERDKLTHRMVDENTKKKRAKKEAALKQMKASVLGTPRTGSIMSSERISTLSPAARRLVNRKFNLGTDKALKASYTPTPSQRSRRGSETPVAKTPTPNSRKTPKGTPKANITDNLLNIPSKTRQKASDFF